MIKIDCAEFQYGHEIAKLIGSPPGYLGHKETPARLKQKTIDDLFTLDVPFTVILFDEIEKASDDLWQLLLGILDRATLTLGDNSRTDFKRTIILMTSNVGAREISTDDRLGFGYQEQDDAKAIEDKSMSAARAKFSPEFLNRLDEIVVFNTLTKEDIDKIMHMECTKVKARLLIKAGIKLEISPGAFKELLNRGFDKRYNARGIRRTIEKEIMTPLARAISSFELSWDDFVVADFRDDKFWFHAMTQKVSPDGAVRIYPSSSLPQGPISVPPLQ
jgi:ATP-dependent Clp protease ATP-binding subunit ClpA